MLQHCARLMSKAEGIALVQCSLTRAHCPSAVSTQLSVQSSQRVLSALHLMQPLVLEPAVSSTAWHGAAGAAAAARRRAAARVEAAGRERDDACQGLQCTHASIHT